MRFKHDAALRHRIAKADHRVANWPACEAGLRQRGDVTFWFDATALARWQAPRRMTPGRQPLHPDLAVKLVLILRLVLHLTPRQAGAFARSVMHMLGLELAVPTTRPCPVAVAASPVTSPGPLGMPVPSTSCLTAPACSVIADGASDGEPVCTAAAARQHDPLLDVVIPPHASAVPKTNALDTQGPHDRHIRVMVQKDGIGWRYATGYGRRNHVETTIDRCKRLVGPRLQARSLPIQQDATAIAVAVLNRMIRVAKSVSVRRT